MTTPTKCPTCGSTDPNDLYSKYDEGGNALIHKKRRPCDNSAFHGERPIGADSSVCRHGAVQMCREGCHGERREDDTGRQVTTPIGEPMPTTFGPMPAPPDDADEVVHCPKCYKTALCEYHASGGGSFVPPDDVKARVERLRKKILAACDNDIIPAGDVNELARLCVEQGTERKEWEDAYLEAMRRGDRLRERAKKVEADLVAATAEAIKHREAANNFSSALAECESALARVTKENERLREALAGILEIGKRDMSNPKYDGYFAEARAALRKQETGE